MDFTPSGHNSPSAVPLTAVQRRTFDDLLAIGAERPMSPLNVATDLEAYLTQKTADALLRWTEKSLWLSKGQLFNALKCEGLVQADAQKPRPSSMHPATAIGIVAHRAIQIAHTHPNRAVSSYVEAALSASVRDADFASFWEEADMGTQSDIYMQITSRTTTFLDSWPLLSPAWTPRFEEPMQAKIGKITLSARADLVLGRPRADMRQTMFLCDLKSGSLSDYHQDEAMFYALVSTIRHGVPPWRSTVYSLASGTYTDPDVTSESLFAIAEKVAIAVNSIVETLTDQRPILLTPGNYCTWCPLVKECPAALQENTPAAPSRINLPLQVVHGITNTAPVDVAPESLDKISEENIYELD